MADAARADVKNSQACTSSFNFFLEQMEGVPWVNDGMLMCKLLLQYKRQRHNLDIGLVAASRGVAGCLQRFQDFCVSTKLAEVIIPW